MYVRKYRDKWRCEVMRNGERASKVFETKREAQAWGHEIESKTSVRATGWRTFEEAAKEYIDRVASKKEGRTWEVRRVLSFVSYFGRTKLGDLDSPDIARWRDDRLKSVSASTVVREANILKHLFSTARNEWRWMDNDPWRGVKLPKESEPRSARWGWKKIKLVIRAGQRSGGKTREVVEAFHIALRTGMRLQEVLSAPDNFDPRRKVVTVKTKTAPKGEEIPVGRIAAKLLTRDSFLVKPNEASTLFAKLTKNLMIDGLTFHDSRGTALTLLSKKVDVMTLARISRHKNINLLFSTYYRATTDEIAAKL